MTFELLFFHFETPKLSLALSVCVTAELPFARVDLVAPRSVRPRLLSGDLRGFDNCSEATFLLVAEILEIAEQGVISCLY